MKIDKWLLVGISAIAIGAGFWAASSFYKSQEASFIGEQDFATFVRPHSPRLGNPDAKVYIVEFLDPECESCRAVYPAVKELMKEYEGEVQLVVRYAPFHHNSFYAIKILEAARKQDEYWETLEVLFQSQPQWGSHHNPQPELIWNYLPSIEGLDIEKLRSGMNDTAYFDLVEVDKEDGKKLNVTGTPTFFVNGKPLEAFGLDYLKAAVQREVEASRK